MVARVRDLWGIERGMQRELQPAVGGGAGVGE